MRLVYRELMAGAGSPFDPASATASNPLSLAGIAGFSFQVTGVPQEGDTFTLSNNSTVRATTETSFCWPIFSTGTPGQEHRLAR